MFQKTNWHLRRADGILMPSLRKYSSKGDADYLTGNYFLRFDDGFYTNYNNCIGNVDTEHQNFYGPSAAFPAPGYTPYIQTNQWYSVVVTLDGTTAKLYVNCELKYSGPQGNISFTNAYDLFLGRLNDGTYPYWLNADLDEVRIYNRALNQQEVNLYGACNITPTCNNWLYTPATDSYATIGDLDVPGNQITVEATFNRTAPLNNVGGYGFLVSKHTGPSDLNYALWTGGCAITTDNGAALISANCEIELNKTYHVAMVYNGSSLKFYRNGFLLSQTPISGNLVVNNLVTAIAQNAIPGAPVIYPFIGYINEVRIWNVARTQAQLQTNMNSPLPSPSTQTGLQAYYTFDNLLNKQGNAAWNAVLVGAASIGATNSNCNFIIDSCGIVAGPVPVTISDFNASMINNKIIKLTWNTEEEIGIKYYTVERAVSGSNDFIPIGSVDSKRSSLRNAYFLADNTAKPNILYQYRLAIFDADGSKKYSAIRTAKIINKEFYTVLYPNPTEGIIKLDINNLQGNATIALINNMGQVVLNRQIKAIGTQSIILDITKFPSGTYWISIQHDTVKTIEKIVKQ